MYVSILCRRFSKGGRKSGLRFQHLFMISYLKFNNDGLLLTNFLWIVQRISIRSSYRNLLLKIVQAMVQVCPYIENSIGNGSSLFWDVQNIALLHPLWCFSNTFWCHNCPRRISTECGLLLVHIHITETYWYDCVPIALLQRFQQWER